MITTLTNLLLSDGSNNYLHLLLINTIACFLIGLSSMFSLFLFNILIHRRNPFSSRPTLTSNGHNHHTHQYTNHHQTNGHQVIKPADSDDPSKSELLRSVLSFAVGGLLGDVFLHLLPEASGQLEKRGYQTVEAQQYLGVRILAGVILFAVMESVFMQISGDGDSKEKDDDEEVQVEEHQVPNGNGVLKHRGGANGVVKQNGANHQNPQTKTKAPVIDVTGYLNLLANGLDNFTHGMSVAASFLVSFKTGALTTVAIIIHEIPHEIADNAILLRSGFSCWAAFRAQLTISLVTFLGAMTVLMVDGVEDSSGEADSSATRSRTLWILPLTAGGFIYIALTSLLPELLSFEQGRKKSTNARRLLQRILLVLAGVATMATVNVVDIF